MQSPPKPSDKVPPIKQSRREKNDSLFRNFVDSREEHIDSSAFRGKIIVASDEEPNEEEYIEL